MIVPESVGFDGLAENIGPFPGPAPLQKQRRYGADQTVPPFWVEFAGPKTNGCCMHGGPFMTMDEAGAFAGKHGGFKMAPLDGWMQIYDSQGRLMMVT